VVKPLDAFYGRKGRDGHTSDCKVCRNTRVQERLRDPAARAIENARSRQWRKDHPARASRSERNSRLKYKFGISADEYDAMFAKQGSRCALCYTTENQAEGKSMPVDHDHATGFVRAILCYSCNISLGKFRDDPALLRKAADYVERSWEPSNS
jgi:hypothetical protein